MNAAHMEFCGSPDWRQMIEEIVIPQAVLGHDLGDDVLEIGPGFGFVTHVLRGATERLTAVEIDPSLATSLHDQFAGTNVEVIEGDATSLDLDADRFTAAVSLNMLHHVPTADAQDQIFSELARVLRPEGLLVAADALPRDEYDEFHEGDTYNPIDPASLKDRLTAAGFHAIELGEFDLGWTASARAGSG
jgi:SAM-dependent methyltransferase